jgi:hypothetical protein
MPAHRQKAGRTSSVNPQRFRLLAGVGLTTLLVPLSGCPFLLDLANPPVTTVRLVNNGDFDVRVVLYYDEQQDTPEDVLDDVGTRVEFTLAPGGVQSFSRDCDDLQAVIVERAELMLIGQIGPEAGSDVLRDGDEFDCRDTITFTFHHSQLLIDFNVSTSVAAG